MYSLLLRLAALTTSAGLLQSSCTGVITTSGGGGGPSNAVTIKFINASNAALDPQFYASPQDIGDPNTTLFVPDNQLTEGFGFAGTGLIPAGQSSPDIIIPCSQARALGTLGGAFKNATSGDQLGTGQKRALSIDYAYLCGDSITFTYRSAGGYSNTFTVQ